MNSRHTRQFQCIDSRQLFNQPLKSLQSIFRACSNNSIFLRTMSLYHLHLSSKFIVYTKDSIFQEGRTRFSYIHVDRESCIRNTTFPPLPSFSTPLLILIYIQNYTTQLSGNRVKMTRATLNLISNRQIIRLKSWRLETSFFTWFFFHVYFL